MTTGIRQAGSPWCRLGAAPALLLLIGNGLLAQDAPRSDEIGAKTVIGVRNVPLKDGADALLAGRYEDGIRLTHRGLEQAVGAREEEAALSNLCAGYLQLKQYDTALKYCEILLARDDTSWRGYNNRALIYIRTEQWEKAREDLERGEALNPGAYTLKVARSIYMDAVHPVEPEVEIDDRDKQEQLDDDSN